MQGGLAILKIFSMRLVIYLVAVVAEEAFSRIFLVAGEGSKKNGVPV